MPEEGSPSATGLRCSVVIPTWQRAGLLRGTLGSLVRQSCRGFDVIVVSDGEDEALQELARNFETDFPLRWIFHPQNRGQAAARNTGAREADGEVLLFLDDDTPADQELVARHLSHHFAGAENCRLAVAGKISEDRCEPFSRYVNRRLQEGWERALQGFADKYAESGAASADEGFEGIVSFGLNCSIRREVFLGSGGFNESLRITDEDTELGLRLHHAGVLFVFDPAAVVTHRSTKDLANYFRGCWGASGAHDVHRVFELSQRNVQTRHLLAMVHGHLPGRLAARCAWHLSSPLRAAAHWLEIAANRSESRLLVGAWARTCRIGEYWSSAKSAGCTPARLKSVEGKSKCALTLHTICEPQTVQEASYYIAPRRFRRFMRWFRATGYRTSTIAQWLRDDVPARHVLLTFDDGYDDLYAELLPLVIEHKYTPVIFLVAGRIGASNLWDQESGLRARNLLTLEQIREMQKHGVEFGSHTMTHPWLPGLSDAELRREVRDSKHLLEDLLGVEIASFAYPGGGLDRRVRSAVADAGYKLAFTIEPGLNWWNDPLCQKRAEVSDRTSLLDFALKLRNGRSLRQSVGNRIRSLEQELPTQTLRNLAGALRSFGHRIAHP